MDRKETLSGAEACVCGQREQAYGSPEDNFQIIADFWSIYVNRACTISEWKVAFTAHDVAVMMSLMKHGRIASGIVTADNYVDGCGYLACAAELATCK